MASDDEDMDRELTIEQAREIARLRARHPGAELRVHERSWGVIVEARRRDHVIALERFAYGGAIEPEQRLGLAA
jgi:hypothetical protein